MNIGLLDKEIALWMEKYGTRILRFALAIIFIWFGILKPLGLSPAADLVKNTISSQSCGLMVICWFPNSGKNKQAVTKFNRVSYAY